MNKIENTNYIYNSLLSNNTESLTISPFSYFIKKYCSKLALLLSIGIATSSISKAQNNDDCLLFFNLDNPAAYNLDILSTPFSTFSVVADADMDADGDIDLIVGSDNTDLLYLENTGSVNNPLYTTSVVLFTNTDFETHPTIADIDGDGDFDILYGAYLDDDFFYLQNTGTVTNPLFTTVVTNPFGLTAQDGGLAPEFVDIDGDGDFDILCGNDGFGQTENITYFQNIGTRTAPNFAAGVADPFGFDNIPGGVNQYIKLDKVDLDEDGDIDFVYGNISSSEMGFLINIGSATAPSFIDLGSDLNLDENISTSHAPIVLDLDFDGQFEAIVGSAQGDLVTYQGSKLNPQISIAEGLSVISCEPITLNVISSSSILSDLSISWYDAAGNIVGTGATLTTGSSFSEGSLSYRAIAVNQSGCSSEFTSFTTISCDAQVGIDLSVTPGYNEAQLSWEVIGSRPVVEYEIYVSYDGGIPNILYGLTTSRTYLADGLLNGVNTTFSIIAVYADGSRSLASNTVTVRPSVVLGENDISENGFAFFPNPNSGEFNIKLQDGSSSAKITVTNLSGQQVYTSTLETTQKSITLGNVAAGMYIVSVKTEKGIYQQKVSVVH